MIVPAKVPFPTTLDEVPQGQLSQAPEGQFPPQSDWAKAIAIKANETKTILKKLTTIPN
jgi:hypothetical protein